MIVYTAVDAEQPTVNFTLYMKRDATPRSERNTRQNYADGYKADLIRQMLNDRLSAILKQENPAFLSASVRDGSFFLAATKDAFNVFVMCRPENVLGGISAVMAETERARRHGFTASEFSRAKAEQLRYAKNAYEERNNRRNGSIVGACVSHFTSGSEMLSPEDEWLLMKELDASVTLADVNAAVREIITDKIKSSRSTVPTNPPSRCLRKKTSSKPSNRLRRPTMPPTKIPRCPVRSWRRPRRLAAS